MRHTVLVVILVGFAVAALAQEGEQILPRIDLPGERAVERQLSVSDKVMSDVWEMTEGDRERVKTKLEEINRAREGLIKELEDARRKLAATQKEIDGVVLRLRKQEEELYGFIKPRVPTGMRADFEVRVRLMSLIRWLGLSQAQADQLVAARKELLGQFGGNPADQIAATSAEGLFQEKMTPEQRTQKRKEHIELVTKYLSFHTEWIKKVEGILTEPQKDLWRTRYLRTKEAIREGL